MDEPIRQKGRKDACSGRLGVTAERWHADCYLADRGIRMEPRSIDSLPALMARVGREVREHVVSLTVAAMLIQGSVILVAHLVGGGPEEPETQRAVVAILLHCVLAQPLFASAAMLLIDGEDRNPLDAARTLLSSAPALVATSLLVFLISCCGLVVLVLPGVYLWVDLMLAYPLVATGRGSGIAAIRESHRLMRGRHGQGLLLVALAVAVLLVVILAAGEHVGSRPLPALVALNLGAACSGILLAAGQVALCVDAIRGQGADGYLSPGAHPTTVAAAS